ncbi:MAG: ABC transporter substrate-binding protein, partial [Nocardioidaceae bacterium]
MNRRRGLLALASAGAMVATLAACGGGNSGGGGGGGTGASGGSWILGTTESITAMDPAGSYDMGSWNMQYNIFQQLVNIPPGGSDVQGDAAKSCDYDNPKTITCKLQPGLKFSNGDALTSSDVKFSFQRNIAIADPNGSSVLLGAITDSSNPDKPKLADGAIETPDDTTVVFHLNQPDQTFLKVLTTATASIVD